MNEHAEHWPADAGYRMPAEWEPHEATWLSWPHNLDTWPGCFERVEPAMVEAVRALSEVEDVHVNVLDADHARHVRRLLEGRADSERVFLHVLPTNDAWIRDHGAVFVTRESKEAPRLALDFAYNAWGGKYPPYDLDQQVARGMAEHVDAPVFSTGFVLEGGSIDVDGRGLLMTTEQCLLNANRNPALSREEIETHLKQTLGVTEVLWLGDGIEGDDTDGHVDDLSRFVAPGRVVTAIESNRRDPNFEPLAINRERLAEIRTGLGRLEVIELPMPAPQFHRGERLPASYANFYVANERVLVPVFACPEDDHACGVLRSAFPGHALVPIDSRGLVAGLGALHCLTQQLPAPPG